MSFSDLILVESRGHLINTGPFIAESSYEAYGRAVVDIEAFDPDRR
jgi:hypothetical protein